MKGWSCFAMDKKEFQFLLANMDDSEECQLISTKDAIIILLRGLDERLRKLEQWNRLTLDDR